jgi:hypothetical protein
VLECFGLLDKRSSPPPFIPSRNLSSTLNMSFYPLVSVAIPYTSHSQPAAYILSRPVYIFCCCLLYQCALYSAHWLASDKCTMPAQDRGNERKEVSDSCAWPTHLPTYPQMLVQNGSHSRSCRWNTLLPSPLLITFLPKALPSYQILS